MASPPTTAGPGVRFEPDEKPPWPIAAGLALQYAILALGGVVLTVAIVFRSAETSETYLAWGAFGALLVCGLATIVQVRRFGWLGSGYVLTMGTSGAFMAVSVAALQQGGPGLLATLVIISALFQFLLAGRLSLLRRILTPTVAGTVIMLIAVNVMPFLFDFLDNVPEGSDPLASPVTVLATLVVTLVVMLRFTGPARLWGPLIGIVAGCVAGAFFGLIDGGPVGEAALVGVPVAGWPGFGFDFGPAFWAILPAYTFVTLVGAIETIGDAVAIQRVSWRKPRATDYRAVQGAVAADGLGNLLSGVFATVPNTTYSSSVSVVEITGDRRAPGGHCHRAHLLRARLPAEGDAAAAHHPRPGDRRLRDGDHRGAVRAGRPDRVARWHGLPQGNDHRLLLLGRRRLSERPDPHNGTAPIPGANARQRDDLGRTDCAWR